MTKLNPTYLRLKPVLLSETVTLIFLLVSLIVVTIRESPLVRAFLFQHGNNINRQRLVQLPLISTIGTQRGKQYYYPSSIRLQPQNNKPSLLLLYDGGAPLDNDQLPSPPPYSDNEYPTVGTNAFDFATSTVNENREKLDVLTEKRYSQRRRADAAPGRVGGITRHDKNVRDPFDFATRQVNENDYQQIEQYGSSSNNDDIMFGTNPFDFATTTVNESRERLDVLKQQLKRQQQTTDGNIIGSTSSPSQDVGTANVDDTSTNPFDFATMTVNENRERLDVLIEPNFKRPNTDVGVKADAGSNTNIDTTNTNPFDFATTTVNENRERLDVLTERNLKNSIQPSSSSVAGAAIQQQSPKPTEAAPGRVGAVDTHGSSGGSDPFDFATRQVNENDYQQIIPSYGSTVDTGTGTNPFDFATTSVNENRERMDVLKQNIASAPVVPATDSTSKLQPHPPSLPPPPTTIGVDNNFAFGLGEKDTYYQDTMDMTRLQYVERTLGINPEGVGDYNERIEAVDKVMLAAAAAATTTSPSTATAWSASSTGSNGSGVTSSAVTTNQQAMEATMGGSLPSGTANAFNWATGIILEKEPSQNGWGTTKTAATFDSKEASKHSDNQQEAADGTSFEEKMRQAAEIQTRLAKMEEERLANQKLAAAMIKRQEDAAKEEAARKAEEARIAQESILLDKVNKEKARLASVERNNKSQSRQGLSNQWYVADAILNEGSKRASEQRAMAENLEAQRAERVRVQEEIRKAKEEQYAMEQAKYRAEMEARLAEEQRIAEQNRLAEEQAQLRVEEEERLRAVVLAAEQEAERLKAEELARVAAEQQAAARLLLAEEETLLRAKQEAEMLKAKQEEEKRIAAEQEVASKLKEEEPKITAEQEAATNFWREEKEQRIAAEKAAVAKLKKEEEARIAAEQEAAAKIKEEEEARIAAEQEAAAKLKKEEEEARIAAEQEAAAKIKEEEEARIAAEQEAAAKLKEEEEARIAAEHEAAAKLKEEEEARIAAEQEASAKLKEEEEARIAAEQEAAAKLKEEEEARIAAEQEAASKLKEEEEARIAAEQEAAAKLKEEEEAKEETQVNVPEEERGMAKEINGSAEKDGKFDFLERDIDIDGVLAEAEEALAFAEHEALENNKATGVDESVEEEENEEEEEEVYDSLMVVVSDPGPLGLTIDVDEANTGQCIINGVNANCIHPSLKDEIQPGDIIESINDIKLPTGFGTSLADVIGVIASSSQKPNRKIQILRKSKS